MSNMELINGLYRIDNASSFISALKIPFVGYRDYADASMYLTGRYGYLWSSSPSSYSQSAMSLNVEDDGEVDSDYIYYRANGLAVRCFKNLESNSS